MEEKEGEGREVILVTSGALAFRKQLMRYEVMMSQSMRKTLAPMEIVKR